MSDNVFSTLNSCFSATAEYPPISINEKNVPYAHLLAQSLFAQKGEMTAINQYTYQSWHQFSDCYSLPIAQIFLNLAKVEMLHMNYLGQMIYLLGLNPCCYTMKNNHPTPWNGTYLNYTVNLKEMLEINLYSENATIKNYQQTIAQIDNEQINAVLERICLDEELHVELLEQLLTQI